MRLLTCLGVLVAIAIATDEGASDGLSVTAPSGNHGNIQFVDSATAHLEADTEGEVAIAKMGRLRGNPAADEPDLSLHVEDQGLHHNGGGSRRLLGKKRKHRHHRHHRHRPPHRHHRHRRVNHAELAAKRVQRAAHVVRERAGKHKESLTKRVQRAAHVAREKANKMHAKEKHHKHAEKVIKKKAHEKAMKKRNEQGTNPNQT